MSEDAKITTPTLDADGVTWLYPDGWAVEHKRAFEAVQGRRIAETKRAEEVARVASESANSPEVLIAAARAEANEAQRLREYAERNAVGEAAWRAAVAESGDRVRRVLTVEGDVIILAAMNDKEADLANFRAANLLKSAKTEMAGYLAYAGAQRDAIASKVVYPDAKRLKELCSRYVSLWGDLQEARDEMILGRRAEEGKEPAP
jgi:hypothetical protein